MRAFLISILPLFALTLHATEQPVPVVDEPKHKTVFENAYVRVIDVQIAPGEITLYHRHVLPSVVVYLTRSTNRSEAGPIMRWSRATLAQAIQSRYAPYDVKPLTHRVTNTGSGLFRVFDIELLHQPSNPAPLAPPTSSALKPHWDEKLARSSSVRLEAKAKTTLTPSRSACLLVGIAGSLQVSGAGGSTVGTRTLKWSDYQFFPPKTRIDLVATGLESAEAVLLELKH